MKIIGVIYSDDNMSKSREICKNSMHQIGFDIAYETFPSFISTEFKLINRDIFKAGARGAGCYWIFKPYIIEYVMRDLNDGDIIVYSDAGVKWIADPRHIIDVMDQDLFLFSNGHQHVHWCKMDCIANINGHPLSTEHQQAQASVIFIRVSDFTRKFIKEWLLWCQMPGFIDDSPSVLPNHPEFAEHRHDQAILTCLAIKYGIRLHWWADKLWYESQRHRWAEDKYPPMWEHHRKRNNEW